MFRSRRLQRALVAACLALLGVAQAPGPAHAHAELASADPVPNGSVVEAPRLLRLTFTEAVDPATVAVAVLDIRQQRVPGVTPPTISPDGLTVTAELPELEPGVFTVAYQVVSRVDGHATAGSYAFLVDPTGSGPPPADSALESSPSVDLATVVARFVALAALMVALGSLVVWRTSARDVLDTAGVEAGPPWSLVAVASLLGATGLAAYLWLAARPIAASGTGIPFDVAGAFGWTPFAIAMRVALLAAAITALLAFLSARRRSDRWWPMAAGLVALALGGMSVAGHAAAIGGLPFAALDWAHLLGAAAWLGGLPAAFVLARRAGSGALWSILRAHGRVALVAAPVVVLSGIANSPLVLRAGRNLVGSEYGNLLLAKATLVGVALGIGAVNHLALRGRGRVAMRRLVGAELVVAALAVLAAATMVTIQAAASRQPLLTAPAVAPAHYTAALDHAQLHLNVSLPAPGTQSYRVSLRHAGDGELPNPIQKVFLTFLPPPAATAPAERVELAADVTGGLWTASGPYTPFVGDWTLELLVRREGLLDASFAFDVEVVDPGAPQLGPPPDTGVGVPGPIAAVWGLLPAGAAGWLPGVVALGVLLLSGRLRPGTLRDVVRGASATVVVVALIGAGSRELVAAANAPTTADLVDQPAVESPDIENGRLVYRANCASCHGVELDGQGSIGRLPPAGPLADHVRSASDAELSYRISYGLAGADMPPFAGSLTAEERSDLIGYLRDAVGSR